MIAFIIGLTIGTFIGALAISCCVSASRADEVMKQERCVERSDFCHEPGRQWLIDAERLILDIEGTVSMVCMTAPYDPDWFTRMHDRQREIIGIIERQPVVYVNGTSEVNS